VKAPQVLIVGCDKGSWQMRGKQIGAALGATVTAKPKPDDWGRANIIILVKHAAHRWGHEARESGARLIWDVLDIWPQPAGNQTSLEQLRREIWDTRDAVGISTLIGATSKMAADIGGIYIPHHSHAGLQPTPIRSRLKVVAYEGNERFLGSWRAALEQACQRLGVKFVINPRDLSAVDLFVAFRGEQWNGLVCRQWKSGVKYVNAIAAGRPTLTQGSAAFFELRAPGQVVELQDELEDAIRAWMPADRRQNALDDCKRMAPLCYLEAVEQRYQALIEDVVRRVA
jgi:hypothetical protein